MKFWDDFEQAGWRELARGKSEFQAIQIVENVRRDRCLVLDGRCQLHTRDSYRYHESIAVIPWCFTRETNKALILGGGDGVAADMLIRCGVKEVVLVDLDPLVVDMSKKYLKDENNKVFENPDLKVIYSDAEQYINDSRETFDLVVCDYTDVYYSGCTKLYTVEHLEAIKKRLNPAGTVVMQVATPIHHNDAYWCMYNTFMVVFGGTIKEYYAKSILPYRVFLPYMQAINGFIMASQFKMTEISNPPPQWCRFLYQDNNFGLFFLAKDELPRRPLHHIMPSTLDNLMYLKYSMRDGLSSFRSEETIYSDERKGEN